MSGVITIINPGFIDYFFKLWMNGFLRAFAFVFPIMILIVPFVRRIIDEL